MKQFARRHRYHLFAFVFLVIVALVSGVIAFDRPEHMSTGTPEHRSTAAPEHPVTTLPPNHLTTNGEPSTTQKTYSSSTKQRGQTTSSSQNLPSITPSSSPDAIESKNGIFVYNSVDKKDEKLVLNPVTVTVGEKTYSLEIAASATVYDAMVQLQATTDFRFAGHDYGSDLGFFVEKINGIANDPRAKKYWIYYIHGQKAKLGISSYHLAPNDIITWKYEDEQG